MVDFNGVVSDGAAEANGVPKLKPSFFFLSGPFSTESFTKKGNGTKFWDELMTQSGSKVFLQP